jgi:hypothetical protein
MKSMQEGFISLTWTILPPSHFSSQFLLLIHNFQTRELKRLLHSSFFIHSLFQSSSLLFQSIYPSTMPAKKSINQGSSKSSFPHKLHALLESATEQGFSHIISWQAGGKSFRVHQPKVFVKSILPQYFKQTKFKSFLRQRKYKQSDG